MCRNSFINVYLVKSNLCSGKRAEDTKGEIKSQKPKETNNAMTKKGRWKHTQSTSYKIYADV